MKTGTIGISLVAVVLGGWALAGSANTNEAPAQIHLQLDLVDGSHLIGVPKVESVPIQTSYAKMDIALNQILAMALAEDHETVSLDLRNGDKLTGVVTLGPVSLDTLFGNVRVGIEHISAIQVFHGGPLGARITEGLVLRYCFDKDEGGRARDKSEEKNDGQVRGATWTAKGKVGGAYQFDGQGNLLAVKDSASLRVQRHTIAAWVRPAAAMARKHCIIVSKEKRGAAGGYYLAYKGDRINYKIMAGGAPARGYYNTTYMMDMPAGTWCFLAGTYDGATRRLYVDGELRASVEEPVMIFHDETDISIGGQEHHGAAWWNGTIDEVMIWRRALSEAEVKQIYNSQK